MHSHRWPLILVLTAFCPWSPVAAQIVQDQSLPVAELEATHQPEDPVEASTRAARSTFFNDPIRLPLTPTSGETIIFDGLGTVRSAEQLTRQTGAIFAGTVNAAVAHLTGDSRWVYSEFTVSVDTVLKDQSRSIEARAPVTVLRNGGALRLPDGRVVRLKVGHHGFPQVGGRYLFFADPNRTVNATVLVAAYSLGTATQDTVQNIDADKRLPSFEGLTPAALITSVQGIIEATR